MADAGIVRNRRKVEATITNARATVALRAEGGLVDLVWSFRPAATPAPTSYDEVPTSSAESLALSKALRAKRVHVRRADDDVRPDGGGRDRRHPPARQPPARLVRGVGLARPTESGGTPRGARDVAHTATMPSDSAGAARLRAYVPDGGRPGRRPGAGAGAAGGPRGRGPPAGLARGGSSWPWPARRCTGSPPAGSRRCSPRCWTTWSGRRAAGTRRRCSGSPTRCAPSGPRAATTPAPCSTTPAGRWCSSTTPRCPRWTAARWWWCAPRRTTRCRCGSSRTSLFDRAPPGPGLRGAAPGAGRRGQPGAGADGVGHRAVRARARSGPALDRLHRAGRGGPQALRVEADSPLTCGGWTPGRRGAGGVRPPGLRRGRRPGHARGAAGGAGPAAGRAGRRRGRGDAAAAGRAGPLRPAPQRPAGGGGGPAAPVGPTSSSSGALSFPLWVRAQVLTAEHPDPAVPAHREYGEQVARARWAAPAGRCWWRPGRRIAGERLSAERDRLARDVLLDPLTGLSNRRLLRRLARRGAGPGTGRRRCCWSTWTTSRWSTTSTATRSATRRCAGWPAWSRPTSGPATWRCGSVATSSRWCWPTGTAPTHGYSPGVSPSSARSPSSGPGCCGSRPPAPTGAGSPRLKVSLSVGVAVAVLGPQRARRRHRLYRLADADLYDAKAWPPHTR